MTRFHNKYRNKQLKAEELNQLREELNSSSTEEIEELLSQEWEEYNLKEDTQDTTDILTRCKNNIDRAIHQEDKQLQHKKSIWWRPMLRYAAVFMLPILGMSIMYLYNRVQQNASQLIAIQTEVQSKATAILPDSTSILLNESSKLSYSSDYNATNDRKIEFQGEGYFRVKKNPNRPFIIEQRGLQIKVLGTSFNLRAYPKDRHITLDLEQGSVEMSWQSGSQKQLIKPGERAIYDTQSNSLTVELIPKKSTPIWESNELVFSNTPAIEVIREIEKKYNIHLKSSSNLDGVAFSGTIPSNNLSEALQILRYSLAINLQVSK